MADIYNTILVYVCNTITFASYADLTSKDGKRYLKAQNKETEFTHYMICKTRRLLFLSANLLQGGQIDIKFKRALPFLESEIQHVIMEPFLGEESVVSIRGNYPEVFVTLAEGREVCFASLFEFFCHVLTLSTVDIGDLLDMEVVYIGQTEISDNYIRLDGHETYCQVADEISKKQPECELFIKVLHFTSPSVIVAENIGFTTQDQQKLLTYARVIPRDHWVTLIEGALIYDLQPKYNVHYKKNFPFRGHVAYSYFFDGPIDVVQVSVNEEFRLYSTIHPNGNRTKATDLPVLLPKGKQ